VNKICFLSTMHAAKDKRIFYKEGVSLAKHGFSVTHICPGKDNKKWSKNGVMIYEYRNSKRKWGRIVNIIKLALMSMSLNGHVYHCNEIDSWLVGVILKYIKRTKVVFDVHEHYLSLLKEKMVNKFYGNLVVSLFRLYINILSERSDGIVLAKKSLIDHFIHCKNKVYVARNFALLAQINDIAKKKCEPRKKELCCIHVGLISKKRGWPNMVKAFERLKKHKVKLEVVGEFTDGTKEEFTNYIESKGLREKISYVKWVEFSSLLRKLAVSDIGIIGFQPGVMNHIYAMPHKLFDYMAAGLPVIIPCFSIEITEIVKSSDCGILANTEKSFEIANSIEYLIDHPRERKRMGINGQKAVLTKYNWEIEFKQILIMYDKLL